MVKNEKKNQRQILDKLGITALNPMQEQADLAIDSYDQVVVLSPTGTGKTLAFLLPLLKHVDTTISQIQTLIITPTRELAMQIEQVARKMGTGLKINAVYGGRSGAKDKIDLKHPPAILVGTPGRIADHIRRANISCDSIKNLVLDEFDKSLEIGFESEMQEILEALTCLEKKVLTSATTQAKIPEFVGMQSPLVVDFLEDASTANLEIKKILSPEKDKLPTLVATLKHLEDASGIIFCNFKDAIERVSSYLDKHGIAHGCFHGGLEQIDRERSLIKFRNGTHRVIIATDLAARGIDISELQYIIHFHLPIKAQEFTHRNGRTARMHAKGTAYVLQWEKENLPDFIGDIPTIALCPGKITKPLWSTLYISGGRKDKISKGDIAGLFFKKGLVSKEDIGSIELQQNCAFIAIKSHCVAKTLPLVTNQRLKTKKVRISKI